MVMTTTPRYYRFGTYLVDAKRRRLWRNREVVPLTAKTFDLLLFLVRRPNRDIGGQTRVTEAIAH